MKATCIEDSEPWSCTGHVEVKVVISNLRHAKEPESEGIDPPLLAGRKSPQITLINTTSTPMMKLISETIIHLEGLISSQQIVR